MPTHDPLPEPGDTHGTTPGNGNHSETPAASEAQAGRWLRPREAEAEFGYNEKYLRRLAHKGAIAARRVGQRDLLLEAGSIAAHKAHMTQLGAVKYTPQRDWHANGVREAVVTFTDTEADGVAEAPEDSEAEESAYRSTPPARLDGVGAHFYITDCTDVIFSAAPLPHVTVTRALGTSEVQRLITRHKVGQYFSDAATAEYITRRIGLKLVHSGRPPTLSHGDNLIVVQLKRNGTQPPTMAFVLAQIGA